MLGASGLDQALAPPPPPPLPAEAERGVRGALQHWRESCLVNAIVLQAWEAAHGRRRDLVIGITAPEAFSAHAWLEGDPVPTADGGPPDGFTSPTAFTQLLRRPAPEYSRDESTWVR
jgi:hypothetical protein